MKINVLAMDLLKAWIVPGIKRRRKYFPSKEPFKCFIDVSYKSDNNKYHTYDVYLAEESKRKHCCFIDIHGGCYLFGEHQDNFPYAYALLEQGFDVVLVDYEPNNGKKDISDIVEDCIANLNHLKERLKDYDLDKDTFFMTGDSAGGHISFLLSLAMQSKEVGLEVPSFDIKGTVLACPVYNFETLGDGAVTNGVLKKMFGPRYADKEHRRAYSPKHFVKYNKLPLFLSTCKNDFIRFESMNLYNDMKDKKDFVFLDIDSDDKNVDHVHNIVKIDLPESIRVNNAIGEFADKYNK